MGLVRVFATAGPIPDILPEGENISAKHGLSKHALAFLVFYWFFGNGFTGCRADGGNGAGS